MLCVVKRLLVELSMLLPEFGTLVRARSLGFGAFEPFLQLHCELAQMLEFTSLQPTLGGRAFVFQHNCALTALAKALG